MPTRALVPFLVLAFGLTWGLAGVFLLFPEAIEAHFGPLGYTNPLFVLAVYSPGLAGALLVWRYTGTAGLKGFCLRLTRWRMGAGWWLVLVLGIPAIFYVGAWFKGSIGDPLPFSGAAGLLGALATALLIGPIEELGWRGVALPLLQRRLAPFWAGLLLGVIWAGWHIPAFLLSGTPQSSWSFPAFFVGVVALSVIVTPMFNAAGGSLLIPVLFHFQTNGPAWPDAQPWDTPLFVLLAVILVWMDRDRMFRRDEGWTSVSSVADSSDPTDGYASTSRASSSIFWSTVSPISLTRNCSGFETE